MMPQEITNKLPNYRDLGFDKFMQKTSGNPIFSGMQPSQQGGNSRTLNFDQVQTSGSLGDKIQVGGENIVIDGGSSRITIKDENNNRVIIGKLDE